MPSDTTRCDFCFEEVHPENDLAETHVCKTCLKDWQVAERVTETLAKPGENE